MIVLSLFDGISCGQLALERAGIEVDKYFASEIDKNAIAVTQYNFPDTVQLGDVRNISYDRDSGILYSENGEFHVGKIDLLIGGSPCTDFSTIGKQKGMIATVDDKSYEVFSLEQYLSLKKDGYVFEGQSYLFWEYVRLLKEIKPSYFLLENVKVTKKWRPIIDKTLGVEPVVINSSLLSAQNRVRLYWTNIEGVSVPDDKGIVLADILDKKPDVTDVCNTMTVRRRIPQIVKRYGYMPVCFNPYNRAEVKDKACTLSTGSMVTSSCATLLFVETEQGLYSVRDKKVFLPILDDLDNPHMLSADVDLPDGFYNIRKLSVSECERLQTLPVGYTNVPFCLKGKRISLIGNGWTVDVIVHIFSFLKGDDV